MADPATELNPSGPGSSDGHADEHKRARVLLVDDHSLVRSGLRELIDAQPDLRTCAEAANLAEAQLAIVNVEPDVIVLDLTLGREDGRDLLRWLALRHGAAPTLVLSMLEEALYASDVLALGARGYLSKSCPPDSIIRGIRSVLAGKVALSDLATERLVKRLAKGRDQRGAAPAGPGGLTADTDRLTPREREVLTLIGHAYSTREIAEALGCAVKTVDSHKRAICEKLGLESTDVLLRYAITHNERPDA